PVVNIVLRQCRKHEKVVRHYGLSSTWFVVNMDSSGWLVVKVDAHPCTGVCVRTVQYKFIITVYLVANHKLYGIPKVIHYVIKLLTCSSILTNQNDQK